MQIAACFASMVKSMNKNKQFERAVHGLFLILGLVTVASVLIITVYLVISGIPAIAEIGLWEFLFGDTWDPASSTPQFGILPFILSSIYGTAGALVLGVPHWLSDSGISLQESIAQGKRTDVRRSQSAGRYSFRGLRLGWYDGAGARYP